ncbi:MAG: hypothetical protein V1772_04740 [Chloroflexota bacterium]
MPEPIFLSAEELRARMQARAAHIAPRGRRLRLNGAGALDQAYNVVLIQAGAANGLTFSGAVLERSAPLFEGAPCFVDHEDPASPRQRSVRDLAGLITDVTYDPAAQCLRGRLLLAPTAGWVAQLVAQFGARPDVLGLSADLWITRSNGDVTAITAVHSVDIVVHPAAGGRFVASRPHPPSGFDRRPLSIGDGEGVPVRTGGGEVGPNHRREENVPMSDELSTQRVQQQERPNVAPTEAPQEPGAPPETEASAGETARQLVRDLARELAEVKLARAALPESLKDHVRAAVAIGELGLERVGGVIERLTHAWAEANAHATIRGLGQSLRVRDGLDRLTLAYERLMGLPVPDDAASLPRLSGIRELYDLLTGDWERRGLYRTERVTLANVTTTTMAQITANVLNKVLLRAYDSRPQWWRAIAYEADLPTMQDAKWITLGGFADLDTVTEGNAYTEKTWDDYAESASFVKKGNYVGVTLEAIDRDDVQGIRAIPRRLGLAAHRTLSAAVAALFTANSGAGPVLADTHNLFEAAHHANLRTAALSADEWDVVVQAMYKQTEFHSSKRLGIKPRWCLVPIELEKTALGIFTSAYEYGASNFDTNVRQMDARHVITVPEWTDANNWAAAADPADLEGACIGYRFGRAPELFVADDNAMGSMFTNDELRIKVRFVYAVGIGDYRALHKSNVA